MLAAIAVSYGAHASYAATLKTQGQREPSETIADLQAKYAAYATTGQKIRVIVVPGHEAGRGGADFADVHESDLVLPIAHALTTMLASDPHFEVLETRTAAGWNEPFSSYFQSGMKAIKKFVDANKRAESQALRHGTIETNEDNVAHNAAPDDVAYRLFGITKWGDENGADLAIHVHLNDAPNHGINAPGIYTGFAIYVPDHQFSNGEASMAFGNAIAARFGAYHATSTFPGEAAGVIEDQELIALGAHDTASFPSVLIEYGYIYEPQLWHPQARTIASTDYAYETYLGIRDALGAPLASKYGTNILPYPFTGTPPAATSSPDAYALQTALHRLGYYPPAGKSFSDCPVSGLMGPCTTDALKAFQKAQKLEQTGGLGPQTRAALKRLLP